MQQESRMVWQEGFRPKRLRWRVIGIRWVSSLRVGSLAWCPAQKPQRLNTDGLLCPPQYGVNAENQRKRGGMSKRHGPSSNRELLCVPA